MNDEFLHRLRQPPPAAFAARLRARLESQAMVRRFRTRQFTLYALIACLLGGTALALVSPSVRTATASMIQQALPESVVNMIESRSQPPPSGHPDRATHPHPAGAMRSEPVPAASSGSPAVNSIVGVDSSSKSAVGAGSSLLARSFPVAAPARTMTPAAAPAVVGVTIEGAKVAASVVSLAIKPFQERQRGVRIDLRASSSEQGIQKLCAGEIEVALAARLILPAEADACRRAGISFIELPIAYEALVVLVNGSNDWADALSPDNLRMLFDPASQGSVIGWNELQPKWPTALISLAAPRSGQGFLESFCEIVLCSDVGNRSDIRLERDELGLSQYVQRYISGLTYLPLASYLKSDARGALLRPLKITNSRGVAVLPSKESIADRSYEPLSRPLLMYVRYSTAKGRAAEDFVQFFLRQADSLVPSSRYLPLETLEYRLAEKVLRSGLTSTVFDTEAAAPLTVREILLRHFPEQQREQERARFDRAKLDRAR